MIDMLLGVLVVLFKVFLFIVVLKWTLIVLFCIFAAFGERYQQSISINNNREYGDSEDMEEQ